MGGPLHWGRPERFDPGLMEGFGVAELSRASIWAQGVFDRARRHDGEGAVARMWRSAMSDTESDSERRVIWLAQILAALPE